MSSTRAITRRSTSSADTKRGLAQSALSRSGLRSSRRIAALAAAEPEWHIAIGTPEEDKLVAFAKGINGAFERRSEADFLGALSESLSWSNVTQPKDIRDKASAQQFFRSFTTAFPDARFTSVALFGVDDVVVSESSMTATHAGPFGPLKPTNKPITIHGLDIMVVKDGKLASGSSYSNSLELLGQEGLLLRPHGS